MLLLPDIRINNEILSIQSPYTLNKHIITDIDISMGISIYDSNGRIIIKTENGCYYRFRIDELEYYFKREMEYFISRRGRDACVEGYLVIDWNNYSFSDYINNIKEQCNNISMHENNYYIRTLKHELERQGRPCAEINRATISSDQIPFGNIYFHNNGRISFSNNNDASRGNRSLFAIDFCEPERKYIHEYNYKPEYIHHYMPGENKDTTLLLGAEIEVDCSGESEEHANKVLEIICGIDSNDTSKALEDKMYCTHDGSLRAGIEFDTMPCSLEYHKNEMRYKEMFKYLDKNGYKAHDTDTCGLHIHVDRKYLGKSELIQQLTISKILYILEKFNDEVCVIARRNNKYSKFVGNGKDENSIIELYAKYKDENKHVALNLKHKESIEFRCFKGTLKYETFILTLEFVKDIVNYAKSINIEQIELIKWSDLMCTFSDELKEYYNIRLEKEKNKKEEKKEDHKVTITSSDISRFVDTNINFNNNIGLNSDETSRICQNIYNSMCITSRIMSSVFGSWNNIATNTNRTQEEELKNKIKSLKKKINNSNNYLEKKTLQQELNETQKELKKEKKKNKLNNNTER